MSKLRSISALGLDLSLVLGFDLELDLGWDLELDLGWDLVFDLVLDVTLDLGFGSGVRPKVGLRAGDIVVGGLGGLTG